ncbi:bifunctional diaminohydroxyphosphoribosylaminopyrimidine deaminase/5-amino-6-(5-phosphoribosylamino)uracil reductase RibD [Nocardioides sp. R-C-SC26]|uniref:bifunctional diaminohydroxyphosphoribosylaminopyrimidine deaminase/5-amino-6-(5-phosphoribosylamino)uracil reductase RibD n=1 Tax=Nocardioides sp. R-C-SC26 TaxID=2870414 RepID=UPI001E45D73D|nr:bifunctional diaminohydroxyphosphoribosylaminopyrimidine deaminase/5-amino-6-(5-phosphoribosylamino)uracil reductase RibD [Nocardioides sp. R-C-SC26]
MSVSAVERTAMRRALALAATPGVPVGPNPRVGCVLLDDEGRTVAEGHHRGAGTAHAEADALQRAGAAARGTTAVVTLEPCNHTGRTGPCAQALIQAGVRRVVFAQSDPNPVASGGGATLRAAGLEVLGGIDAEDAGELNRTWTFAIEQGRPFVTWKFAATLDGRSAAADGSSRWITSAAARRDTHRLRALCDTMLVGTGTVETDDPRLTVRDEHDVDLPIQPLRAVMGLRDLDPGRRILDAAADTVRLRTRDPREALRLLRERDRHHVFLEGGPALAAAFLRAGLVDEIVAYLAPTLLGAGASAVGDFGVATIGDAFRPEVVDVHVLTADPEHNVRFTLRPVTSASGRPAPPSTHREER